MENEIQPTQVFTPPIIPPTEPTKILSLVLLGLIISAISVYVGIQIGKNQASIQQPAIVQQTISPTQTAPNPSITKVDPISDKEKVKNQIETSTNPRMTVEALDISPVEPSLVVFLGHNDQWNKFGIYIFNLQTNKFTSIYETTENITGRGGGPKDNTALEFSPTGEAFFVNRTGINFPSFFIIDSKGKVLYKSESDLGHGTWISGQELVFISDGNILVYSIINQKPEITKLSADVFHLHANKTGTQIISFSLPKNELQCQSFDMHIYNYPSGTEVKSIPNTTLSANWTGNNNITYEKVTSCNENQSEGMMGYPPVIENRMTSTL